MNTSYAKVNDLFYVSDDYHVHKDNLKEFVEKYCHDPRGVNAYKPDILNLIKTQEYDIKEVLNGVEYCIMQYLDAHRRLKIDKNYKKEGKYSVEDMIKIRCRENKKHQVEKIVLKLPYTRAVYLYFPDKFDLLLSLMRLNNGTPMSREEFGQIPASKFVELYLKEFHQRYCEYKRYSDKVFTGEGNSTNQQFNECVKLQHSIFPAYGGYVDEKTAKAIVKGKTKFEVSTM